MAKAKKKPTTAVKKVSKPVKKANSPASNKDSLKSLNKPLTRTQQITYLADSNSLPKKNVASVMDSFEHMISNHLKQLGEISIGGLMKLMVIKKPATKAKEGINPFTGEPTVFKAKPARKVVKIRALKKIKDMVL